MHWPFAIGNWPLWNETGEGLAWWDWAFFDAFVESKFITLFSVLFGASFALQLERTQLPSGEFRAIYLRRLAILALFGIAHGLLLYSAEVLLAYAVIGLMLFGLHRLPGDLLLRAGLALLGVSVVWAYVSGYVELNSASLGIVAVAALAVGLATFLPLTVTLSIAVGVTVIAAIAVLNLPGHEGPNVAEEFRAAQWLRGAMRSNDISAWPTEFRVRKLGSFADLFRLHTTQYRMVLEYIALVLVWRTLALFLIGAALIRSGLLERLSQSDWARVALIGLGIGVPLSCLATGATALELHTGLVLQWPLFVHALSSLPLAAGIAAGVHLLHRRHEASFFWRMTQAAGRMALTNYLGQSAVMALLAESWGLGWYAQLSGPALTLLAILVWAALALASFIWLRYWRMGPLEWLWRCGTYWRLLPNRVAGHR